MAEAPELVLRPRSGWQSIDLRELWAGRNLFRFLVWRDIKVRYKQTLLGGLWAILQPFLAMVIFTIFFNRFAGIAPEGQPYPLFSYAGLILWIFFSNAVTMSSNSLVGSQALVSKIYFPRLFIPLASVGALLLDFFIGLLLMAFLLIYYEWPIGFGLLWLPIYILGATLTAAGLGLILSGLNVQFRDVKYAVPFFLQMGMFVSPVIYPLSYVPAQYRLLFALNPMTGLVEGFRNSLLGGRTEWGLVAISCAVSVLVFMCGTLSFRRMERQFADII
jgi:lipopolysaccharide transport system permease protein